MRQPEVTLHIDIDAGLAHHLEQVARERGVSVSELVGATLDAEYRPEADQEADQLSAAQSQALAAYVGGYIGLGGLASALGMPPLQARAWLREHELRAGSHRHNRRNGSRWGRSTATEASARKAARG